MKPIDVILVLVIVAIVGIAVFSLVKAKKDGKKCIGCPHASTCGKTCNCSSQRKTDH